MVWVTKSEQTVVSAQGWINNGGRAEYNVSVQPPDIIRAQLERLGMNPENLERKRRLVIDDFYTVTLGKKPSVTMRAPASRAHLN